MDKTEMAHMVRSMREGAGQTQSEAAATARLKLRFWQEVEAGQKKLSDGHLELYMRKTGYWQEDNDGEQ